MKRLLPGLAALGCVLIPGVAWAAPSLAISAPCFSSITITGDGTLTRQEAELDGRSSHVTFISDETQAQVVGTRCDSMQDLRLRVRPGTTIAIADGGSTEFRIDGVGGAIDASLRGGGLTVDRATDVSLRLQSGGDARIDMMQGNLLVDDGEGGDVSIGRVEHGGAASVTLRGSGDLTVANGRFETLAATTHGSGDIVVHGTVGSANLSSFGSGDVLVDRVTDAVGQQANGSGSVLVTDSHGARVLGDSMLSLPQVATPPHPPVPPFQEGAAAGGVSITPGGIVVPGFGSITPGGIAIDGHGDQTRTIVRSVVSIVMTLLVLGVLLVAALIALPIIARRRGRSLAFKAPAHDPRLARLVHDLSALEPRLARLEHYVTTKDFNLRRELRALER